MKKGIILGNGINNRIGIESFSLEQIRRRFVENIKRYMPLFEASFDKCFDETEMVDRLLASTNWGIETLSGIVYEYISKQFGDDWSVNDDIRLQDLLSCIAITTIFLDQNGKRRVVYQEDKLPDFNRYDYIFSLNYYEFWDKKKVVKPLHGYVDLSKIYDDSDLLVSIPRMRYEKYKTTVDELSKANKVQMIDLSEVIFAPSTVDKNHLICVVGLYPSNKIFPAEDLDLINPKTLYEELKEMDEIDIFGMSPYGDDSIIDIINSMKKVRVFVYNKASSTETKDWEDKLTGDYEILDSNMI